ncbi:hypothetical protein L2E82_04177 [Cichorium intybus]|uniref:Uncharacterized protein n=1 Tax=Cichorium intybus TaxID=13427 RepID=A0ACB9H790_CICIN|nr:hypothetical protein L2E82_04177 [Cichorium intybus]
MGSARKQLGSVNVNYTSGTTSSPKGAIHSHRGTFIVAVDSLLECYVSKQSVYLRTLSDVPLGRTVHIMTAGALPRAAVLLRTESLSFDVTHGYGLTETGGLVVACSWKRQWNPGDGESPIESQVRR